MKQITIWERQIKEKKKDKNGQEIEIINYVHNHIEDGWIENDSPMPKSQAQMCWKNEKWRKHFGYLNNNVVNMAG